MYKLYFDFEANDGFQIIAMGVIDSCGNTFYSLARCGDCHLSKIIRELTNITPEDLKNAPTLSTVLINFKEWVTSIPRDRDEVVACYTYGNEDVKFLANSIRYLPANSLAEKIAFDIAFNIVDAARLCGGRSLKSTYETVTGYQSTQHHNALIDAEKLKVVCEHYNVNQTKRNFSFLKVYKYVGEIKNLPKRFDDTFYSQKTDNYIIKAIELSSKRKFYFKTYEDFVGFIYGKAKLDRKWEKETDNELLHYVKLTIVKRRNKSYYGYKYAFNEKLLKGDSQVWNIAVM